MVATGAADPGKPFLQLAALEIGPHNIGHDRTKKSVVKLEPFLVEQFEPLEVILHKTVQRRIARPTGMIFAGDV
jgi:hypothetical protein